MGIEVHIEGVTHEMEAGIDSVESMMVNFSYLSQSGTALSIARKFELVQGLPDPDAFASTGPGGDVTYGNGIIDIFFYPENILSDSRARRNVAQATEFAIFHEVLHHAEAVDSLVESAMATSAFSALAGGPEDENIRRFLEEKALRDDLSPVSSSSFG